MLDKKYDHVCVEKGKYDFWLKGNYFTSGDMSKEPFCIVIPPPNVTGRLHLGHAWNTTLQDIIIRYKRMDGYDTLWLPGMDHAGIATQAKIDKRLKSLGYNPRGMDRDEWLKYAWEWKNEYASFIHSQWAKLGLSLDYSKERFTLDEGLSKAVNKVFVSLYNEGLIYRGERIINWDPLLMTALSNEEVIYKDVEGAFYYIKYYIEDSNDYLTVATTRPETLFGDTAVAVNPNDLRYKDLIGKNVILPVVNKRIPIIGDEHADPEFGTGCVKITPAHDPNDFEVGNRHGLERVVVINSDGTMNDKAGKYVSMDRFACRNMLVKDLDECGLLVKVEKIVHSVGHSERSDVMVEPYLSKQWFVRMRPLADRVLENQRSENDKVNFVPTRFEKIMNHWMDITYDWCISRQLWWGHRIPVWYKGDEMIVSTEAPIEGGWVQDSDVLDTWFSSALWPFSTLGWPSDNELVSRYYPNNVLVTAYDIIPFWVNRMTFQGLHFMDKRPFKDCLIHGLIRDSQGRKMSKSLGNGVDPMDVIEEYGTDSLRYFLATSSALGQDLRYDTEKVKSTWNFINKLWNASRFCLMNFNINNLNFDNLNMQDRWILTKYEDIVKEVRRCMDKYEFNNVGSILYAFIWDDFCDNYIEMAKFSIDSIGTQSTLYYVLMGIIKMLHPFMPYVTEEIYQKLPFKDSESIMISKYPKYDESLVFDDVKICVDNIIDFVGAFRNVKQENNISKHFKFKINNDEDYTLIKMMLKLDDSNCVLEDMNIMKYDVVTGRYSISIYYEKAVTEEDMLFKKKQCEILQNSIERRKKLLSNQGYLSKAPKNLIDEEKLKLKMEEEELAKLIG